jgi:hypothetical protein
MTKLKRRTWEGIASLAWACFGFAFFRYWLDHRGFQTLLSVLLVVFVLWWGVSLLLALSGLRSGSWVGVSAGTITVIGFLAFFWTLFHG